MPSEKGARITAKSIIMDGIEAGKSVNYILARVAKKFPDSKAEAAQVKYYAGMLVRAGLLDYETAAKKYAYKKRGEALAGTKASSDAPAKKTPAKRKATTAAKAPAKKAPVKRKVTAAAKKAPAKKAPAKKAPAKKAPAKKAPVKRKVYPDLIR